MKKENQKLTGSEIIKWHKDNKVKVGLSVYGGNSPYNRRSQLKAAFASKKEHHNTNRSLYFVNSVALPFYDLFYEDGCG